MLRQTAGLAVSNPGSAIRLVDYDPEWPRRYRHEAARIEAVLHDRVLSIEQVGSTSVPGLAAKPIIDILVVVGDSADEPPYAEDLEAAGYPLRIREPAWHEHRMFKGPDADINLHVFSDGCPEIDRMLRFRNRLRTTEADRQLYEQTKRELGERRRSSVQDYADAKTDVIEQILRRAGDEG